MRPEDWLARAGAEPARVGVLVDFDGTLADVVDDPATARPRPGALDALAAVAGRVGLVAVVSGRPGAFLHAHVAVPGIELWGSYGLERVVGERVEVEPDAAPWAAAVAEVVTRAGEMLPAGTPIEDKGLTVTLHWRTRPAAEGEVRRFAEAEAARTGLAVHDAKMSVELRPPLAIDKGTVVRRILSARGGARIDVACFVGDDVGDVDGFEALGAVEMPLRVAVRSAETPPGLLSMADVVVDGPAGAVRWLQQVAASV